MNQIRTTAWETRGAAGKARESVPIIQISEAVPTLTTPGRNVHKVCQGYRRQRRGAAAVEFAIVAPLFVMMVFGMLEYGRMVMVQQLLTNASREGARMAVLDGAKKTEVEEVVKAYLADVSVNGAAVVVSPDPELAAFGDPITVQVEVSFDQVSWLPGSMFNLGGKMLMARSVMRRESAQ